MLTAKFGMTSHAALVAGRWGRNCLIGCGDVEIASDAKSFVAKNGVVIKEVNWIGLHGTEAMVYQGSKPTGKKACQQR
jgi:pyruvate,orthophosphate dikinase